MYVCFGSEKTLHMILGTSTRCVILLCLLVCLLACLLFLQNMLLEVDSGLADDETVASAPFATVEDECGDVVEDIVDP